MIAAYYRVSSKAQDLAMQRAAVERLAAARGDTIASVYSEKLSGKSLDRPELQRLRAEARQLTRLYVFRLDRLTRSGIKDTLTVIEELRAAGVEVVSVADGFDLNGPAAEIVLAVLAWAAKMERLAINERISAARIRMEGEGRSWGRPARFNAILAGQCWALRAEGRSIRQIAMALKVSKSTVGKFLQPRPSGKAPAP